MNLTQHKLATIYDEIERKGLDAAASGVVAIEPLPTAGSNRWGLSLVIRVQALGTAIGDIIDELTAAVGTAGLVYDANNLHVTVRSIEGYFPRDQIDGQRIRQYCRQVSELTHLWRGLRLSFKGLCFAPSGILIKGYPADSLLEVFRAALFQRMVASAATFRSPENSIQTIRNTCHSSLVLFEDQQPNLDTLRDIVARCRDTFFISLDVEALDLVAYERTPRVVELRRMASLSKDGSYCVVDTSWN